MSEGQGPGSPTFWWSVAASITSAVMLEILGWLPSVFRSALVPLVAAAGGAGVGALASRHAGSGRWRLGLLTAFAAVVAVCSSLLPGRSVPRIAAGPGPATSSPAPVQSELPPTSTPVPTSPVSPTPPATPPQASPTPPVAQVVNATRLLNAAALYEVLVAPSDLNGEISDPEDEPGRGAALGYSDPKDLTLCSRARWTYRGLVDDAYRLIESRFSHAAVGSEASTFRDRAAFVIADVRKSADTCGIQVRYDTTTPHGRVIALVLQHDNGYTKDWILMRRGSVVAQVVLISRQGSHSADADQLADGLIGRLEKALA